MREAARITYDLDRRDGAPAAGDYLVTVGRRGIGSVYQIAGARASLSRVPPAGVVRWVLDVLRAPDARPLMSLQGGQVACSEPATRVWRLIWYQRRAKGH